MSNQTKEQQPEIFIVFYYEPKGHQDFYTRRVGLSHQNGDST